MTSLMPPIICITGYSGCGKTTLIERLIPPIKHKGFRVGTIKHHGKDFCMDKPGKDSHRHKNAGAYASMIASPFQIAMVLDSEKDHSPEELLYYFRGHVDIVLAEGFKRSATPKMELYRRNTQNKPQLLNDPNLIALISDEPEKIFSPQFHIDDIPRISNFMLSYAFQFRP